MDLNALEKAILEKTDLEECYIAVRRTEKGEEQLVIYAVGGSEVLKEAVMRVLPGWLEVGAYVRVRSLPRTRNGEVNDKALQGLEVIDEELVKRWEKRLAGLSGVEKSAVVVRERQWKRAPLHVWDLLPNRERSKAAEPAGQRNATLALVEGEALRPVRWLTLGETLRRAAQEYPEAGVSYIDGQGSETFETYLQLWQKAQRVAGGLKGRGLKKGQRVMLRLESHREFIGAFWGVVLAGMVPVPVSSTAAEDRWKGAWETLGRPLVVTDRKEVAVEVALIEELESGPAVEVEVEGAMEETALVMLTSGSTDVPKAVALSHRNLCSRAAATVQMNGFSKQDVSLSWVPMDHVASLIYFHLRDVYTGCRQVQVQTGYILEEPLNWLDLLERYEVTVTFGPNFAYGLVNERLAQSRGKRWDLSKVRQVLNGGESIVARTARRFLAQLAEHGLRADAMRPAWGMSETSSGVVYGEGFGLASSTDQDVYVEVGRPIPGLSLRIVGAGGELCAEGEVGQLQVKGTTVTSGYENNEAANREAFTEDGWFKTGDLGCVRQGRLTIVGRSKDVIIFNGVHYPSHRIEAEVEAVAGVEPSHAAACEVRAANGTKVAVFFSTDGRVEKRREEWSAEIRGRVARQVGLPVDYVIELKKEEMPRTSLGKIQRTELKRRFEGGDFDEAIRQVDLESGNQNTVPNWFYRKQWKQRQVRPGELAQGGWLILVDELGLGQAVAQRLRQSGRRCVVVEAGSSYEKQTAEHYRIDVREPGHYKRLLEEISGPGAIEQVLHLWSYAEYAGEVATIEQLKQSQEHGVYSVLSLVQALVQAQGRAERKGMSAGDHEPGAGSVARRTAGV